MSFSDIVVCPQLQTYFIDKDTGAPLSGGKVYFYSQNNPTVPKNIYQQSQLPNGEPTYTLMQNPVILNSIGTFGDESGNDINVFLYPFVGSPLDANRGESELYYIEVKSSGDVMQFPRSFWPPAEETQSSNPGIALSSTNQITNSQFIQTSFIDSATFNVSGTNAYTSIAPGWKALTSGSGTLTVTQIPLPLTSSTNGTNAPYALQIDSSGLDAVAIVQRFEADPLLLAGGFISGYAQIASLNGSGAQSVSLQYRTSAGSTVNIITESTNNDESFKTIQGTVAIPSTNTDVAPDGFIDFVIVLPKNIRMQVTSVQLVGATTLDAVPPYLPLSTQLQVSNLYWYDKPWLNYKPIDSYLVGWDFSFNPAQFLGDSGTVSVGANKSQYIWDQTIAFQTVSNSLGFSRDSNTGSLVITPSSDTSFALVQYLGETEAREILSQRLSVQLKAQTSATSLLGTVSMFWTTDSTLPDLNSANFLSLVSGITDAVPTAANGSWTQVPYIGTNQASFELTSASTIFDFNGFDATATAGKTTATFFAIVIAFDTLAASSTMTIDYCSLVPGDIPTRPAYKSVDETLRLCQYYYEKSYQPSVIPGTASETSGERKFVQFTSYPGAMGGGAVTINCRGTSFELVYDQVKRTQSPAITLYSPSTGSANSGLWTLINSSVVVSTSNVVSSNWSQVSLGNKCAGYDPLGVVGAPTTLASVQGPSSCIIFQYTCDARLGLIT